MTKLEVVHYPEPVLRRGGKPVTAFGPELRQLAEEMLATMYSSRGVGLAAPQVGRELDLLVLNPEGSLADRTQELVLVNPRILSRKRLEFGDEGCLSFPGIYAEVERHRDIVATWQDVEGRVQEGKASGFVARIIQHEMDHLQGVLFVDRLSPADRIRVKKQLEALERRARIAT
ncbi:MAG: peptide deformylase [Planctomycetes bacterium]|nr:peptide deformylase [Planctomycetota bacterium]